MNRILSGRELAQRIREDVNASIEDLVNKGNRRPSLTIIIAGDDAASLYYADLIKRSGAKIGIDVDIKHEKDPHNDAMNALIDQLNDDQNVDGILIQLPLPPGIDKTEVFNRMSPAKDVDGQTPVNIGRLITKQSGIFPATARAVIRLLKGHDFEIEGKKTVVIGRSTAVGLPAAVMLIHENATVTVCHSKSRPLKAFTSDADIIVVSAGKPELLKAEHVKEGAVVIDVGTNEVDGQIVGDVDFDGVAAKASVSPATGGVGAITLASLLENTYELYRKNILCNADQ